MSIDYSLAEENRRSSRQRKASDRSVTDSQRQRSRVRDKCRRLVDYVHDGFEDQIDNISARELEDKETEFDHGLIEAEAEKKA